MAHRLRDETGAVAVVVALSIVVLVGMAALAVDAGYLYSVRRQLQTAADAAALAGCRVMVDGGSDGDILAEARMYAEDENAVRPADAAVMLADPPDTVVDWDERSVQVTVSKQSPLFFARIFGVSDTPVRATAKAKVAYLTGLDGLLPVSLSIIKPDRMTAIVRDGQTGAFEGEYELGPANAGRTSWGGSIPFRLTADKRIDVVAYNSFGIPEPINYAAAVAVRDSSEILDVGLSDYMVTQWLDESVRVTVRAGARPSLRFNNRNYNMSAAGTDLWEAYLEVPGSDSADPEAPIASYPVQVSVGGTTIREAAMLVVRRNTHPVTDMDVALSQSVFERQPSQFGSVNLTVQLNDYQVDPAVGYGDRYYLTVGGGAVNVGNCQALDFSTTSHTGTWYAAEYPELQNADLAALCRTGFTKPVHIGDAIYTQTAGFQQVIGGLEDRISGDPYTDLVTWRAMNPRPASSRVVYLPIVEWVEAPSGTSPVCVAMFGAFFVEEVVPQGAQGGYVIGRFIEEAAPSDALSDTPTGELYVETVHLVTPN